jgi:O-antigen ligase
MPRIIKILFYSLFIILPWKAALPGIFGDITGQYIDKIIVLSLFILTINNWRFYIIKIKIPLILLLTFYSFILIRIIITYDYQSVNTQFSEYLIPILMVLVAIGAMKSKEDLNTFLKFFVLYSGLIAFLCILELFNEPYRTWANEIAVRQIETTSLDDIEMRFRSRFFFSSPMGYGMHNVIALMFAVKLFKVDKIQMHFFYVIATILTILGLIGSLSRGPWMALILSVFIYFSLTFKENFKFISKLGLYSILLLSLLLITVPEISDLLSERFSSILDWNSNNSNVERIQRWNNALNIFQKNIWTGIGISATGATGVGFAQSIITENYYLKIGIEGGLILLTLFILLHASILLSLIRWKNRFKENALYFSFFISFLVYMFIFQILDSRIIAYEYWAIIGFSLNNSIKTKISNEL